MTRRRAAVTLRRPLDGPIEIDFTGLVQAWDRRVRRWRQAWFWSITVIVVGLAIAVIVLVLRWDVARSRELAWMRVEIREARQQTLCWRALALDRPSSLAQIIPASQRVAWVTSCVRREIVR